MYIAYSDKKSSIFDYSYFFNLKKKLTILFLFICAGFSAQHKEFWLIDIQTEQKKVMKDSAQAIKFLDSLVENSHFFTQIKEVKKEGKTTRIVYDKGENYNKAQVKISDSLSEFLSLKKEFVTHNLDSLKRAIHQKYREKGFAFNRVRTQYLGMQNKIPVVEIHVVAHQQRKIDGFVLKGYERVPRRFVKNLEKEFRGAVYDDKNILAINQRLTSHPFVLLEKPPQTLFTRDSTQVYLFLKKKKSNTFDGILGFGNNESDKFSLNGSAHVDFKNLLNGFEKISIFWQRNPDRGQTFDLQTDIPYLLKSNIGINTHINVFRQDSTFANVKILPSLYYQISYRQKIGIRANFEVSSILAGQYTQGQGYDKKGLGLWYEFSEPTDIELFLYKTHLRLEGDWLKTSYAQSGKKIGQSRYFLLAERNFQLVGNHYLNMKSETAFLTTQAELSTNELFRIGGWNSFRGFNENSLLGDWYTFGGAEYRYLVNRQAFFDVFVQYGLLHGISNLRSKLYSFGMGFNFFLPIGLMSFQISNGTSSGNPIQFNETKIHWGILTRF